MITTDLDILKLDKKLIKKHAKTCRIQDLEPNTCTEMFHKRKYLRNYLKNKWVLAS